jgi:hypothetical protein
MWSPTKSVGIIEPDGILKGSIMDERTANTTKSAITKEDIFSNQLVCDGSFFSDDSDAVSVES